MNILYEDDDFKLTCSNTNFNKWVIFCPSAEGLPRVTLEGIISPSAQVKPDPILDNIYTSLGINEINFISKTANWYQSLGALTCIKILKNIIKGYEENTIIYGISMGGFGAIHFGLELGITSVAFSPQVTLDNNFNIAENWKKIANYIIFNNGMFKSNIIDKQTSLAPIYLFYDGSHVLDKKHAIYIIKKFKNCISFNIPWGGHACSGKVNKSYGIKKIICEIIEKKFDKQEFKKIFFSNYNIEKNKVISAWSRFKYLYDIINDNDFFVKLGILRTKKYFDLCAGVCNIIEKSFPKKLSECIDCLIDDNKIINHTYKIKKENEINFFIENSYERKKVCALFYQKRNQYKNAEFIYRILYEKNKYDIDVVGNLAIIMMKQGHAKEAFYILFNNLLLVGKNEVNMYFLARVFFLNKDYINSRKWLQLSINHYKFLNKNISIEVLILYSRTYREEGQITKAIEFLNRYLIIGNKSGNYLAHLGAFYVMINQNKKGLFFLQQAKLNKVYPEWTNLWINKALKKI